VALVRRKTDKGTIKIYSFFGTGNLNEQTASIYADHGLLTASQALGEELDDLFGYLYKRKAPKMFKHLLVSQFNIVDGFFGLIDREIKLAQSGKTGHIIIKLSWKRGSR
jgi:polyphosphate kinase